MFVLEETHLMKQRYVDLQTSLDTPSSCNKGVHKNKQTNNGVVSFFKTDCSLWIVATLMTVFELKALFSPRGEEFLNQHVGNAFGHL